MQARTLSISLVISSLCLSISACVARYITLAKNTMITSTSVPISPCAQSTGNPDNPGGGPRISAASLSLASFSTCRRSRRSGKYDGFRLLHCCCIRALCTRRHLSPHVRCRWPTRASGVNHPLHTEHGLRRLRHFELPIPQAHHLLRWGTSPRSNARHSSEPEELRRDLLEDF